MLLDCASLIALMIGDDGGASWTPFTADWYATRSLSFLQLCLRELGRVCYECLPLPKLLALPKRYPPPACASRRKRRVLEKHLEFSKVLRSHDETSLSFLHH